MREQCVAWDPIALPCRLRQFVANIGTNDAGTVPGEKSAVALPIAPPAPVTIVT
jgi:hypothetical protein